MGQFGLKILYRIMNLIDDTSLTSDERIDLSFRYDADEEHIKKEWNFLIVMRVVALNGYMMK